MKRKYNETIFFGKYECNLKKKICFEVYWSDRKKIKFENKKQIPEIIEIDLYSPYICMIHDNDKCMCSIYDCCGIKKKHSGSNNISQFI